MNQWVIFVNPLSLMNRFSKMNPNMKGAQFRILLFSLLFKKVMSLKSNKSVDNERKISWGATWLSWPNLESFKQTIAIIMQFNPQILFFFFYYFERSLFCSPMHLFDHKFDDKMILTVFYLNIFLNVKTSFMINKKKKNAMHSFIIHLTQTSARGRVSFLGRHVSYI